MDIMNDTEYNSAIVIINEAIAIMSDLIDKVKKIS